MWKAESGGNRCWGVSGSVCCNDRRLMFVVVMVSWCRDGAHDGGGGNGEVVV